MTKREGWRPIKTAPKDDTVIDIWSTNHGRLTNMRRRKIHNKNIFYEPAPRHGGLACVRDAKHWMPIPDDPKEEE